MNSSTDTPAVTSGGTPGEGRSGRGRVVRAILLVSLAVLFLLAASEAVERTWLSGAGIELLQLVHRIRGTAVALILAGLTSWLILRSAPPLLAAPPVADERGNGARIHPDQKRLHYARWFIVMRWIAVVVAAVLVLAAIEFAELLPRKLGPTLGAIIVGLALVNLGYSFYLRRGRVSSGFLAFQTYVDVGVLILLLHFSGGVENPLTPLLLLHVIIAGIVLGRTHSYLVAGVASALFAFVAWGEWSGVLSHYMMSAFPHSEAGGDTVHAAHDALYVGSRVGLQTAILLLVAYFTTTLVERIRQDERQLEALADQALAQAQMLERALDTTGTALCLCDRELRPYWKNGRWEEWTGRAPAIRSSMTSCGSQGAYTLEDGQIRTGELRIGDAVGPGAPDRIEGARILQLTTAPLRDRDGRISHVVTLARDVTEEQEAQQRVVRAERMAAVGELAGQVAHEVNNPIAIISAKARLLLREGRYDLPEKAAQEITKITELADRVARIAQGLLSYCRPAPGVRSPVDVRHPLRRALTYVEPRAEAAGVRIVDELPERLPCVQANASELEQVFLNLFLNALDAMPAGGELHVAAGLETGGSAGAGAMLAVVVEDTGSGIPAAIRDRIFEPFLTTKGDRKGSGLGLSICLGLVRSHGGQIGVASEPGQGTRVTVCLPALSPPAPWMGSETALQEEEVSLHA